MVSAESSTMPPKLADEPYDIVDVVEAGPSPASEKAETVVAEAEAAGLNYVSDHEPGISRRKAGKGVGYRRPDGSAVKDAATIARIRALAIPPAYTDVWISDDPDGHIQATGRDDKGRKQYRYHTRWRLHRDESKYGRMAAFGAALPNLRARVDADLRKRDLSRDKVLATVVKLLEQTLIRVGNEDYVKQNKSFGLTTLRKRHAAIDGVDVGFKFRGKSGVMHDTHRKDRRLARIVREIQELPGQRLFKFVGEDGELHAVESADVNAYLREALEGDFTAKDFRTWAGTLAAARALADEPSPATKAEAKKTLMTCVKSVARRLGNTPAVCRACYIHPRVLDAYAEGRLGEAFADADGRGGFEAVCLAFLEDTVPAPQAATA